MFAWTQQTLGGNGYSKEYHVERLVRDIRMFQFGEGTTEILKVVIGGSIRLRKEVTDENTRLY